MAGPAMRRCLAYLAMGGMILSGQIAAREPPTRHYEPTAGWRTMPLDIGCRVARDFSDGRAPVSLWIDRYGPGSPLTMALVGDSIRAFPRARETRVSFRPGGNEDQQVGMYQLRLGTDEVPVTVLLDASLLHQADWEGLSPEQAHRLAGLPHPAAEELRLAAGITSFAVSGGLVRSVDLATGPLVEPVTALQACTDGMLRSWGLDPEVQNHLTRKVAVSDSQALAQAFGYPMQLALRQQGAGLRGYLIVGPDGLATQCHLTMPSALPAVNEEACRTLTSRAWFDPALDATGNPVESYFTLTLRFASSYR